MLPCGKPQAEEYFSKSFLESKLENAAFKISSISFNFLLYWIRPLGDSELVIHSPVIVARLVGVIMLYFWVL